LRKAVCGGTTGRRAQFSDIAKNKERKNRGIFIKKIILLVLLITNKRSTNGTFTAPEKNLKVPVLGTESTYGKEYDEDRIGKKWIEYGTVMIPVPEPEVSMEIVPVIRTKIILFTGTDEEMRDLARDQARTMTPEEEEELLNYSEEEGPGTQAGGADDEEMKDAEEARLRAEKEAEESDRLAKLAEIQERIRRRKAEKERRALEQKMKEDELRQAEQDRIRADGEQSRLSFLAEEERRIHLAQIQRLEEELRKAEASRARSVEGLIARTPGRSQRPVVRWEQICSTCQLAIEQSGARS